MQTEKFQPESKQIMPETRFTEFLALFIDSRVEISRTASETDVGLCYLPVILSIVIYYPSFFSCLTFYVA